jgi:hypothetical protein
MARAFLWCVNCGKWEPRCCCKALVICVDPHRLEEPAKVKALIPPRPPSSFTYGKRCLA